MRSPKAIVSFIVLAVLFTSAGVCPAEPPAAARVPAVQNKDARAIVMLLEKSGYKYTTVSDGVWEITFTGKNTGDFPVRLAIAGDIVLAIAKLADRKELKPEPAFLTKLLECNDRFDFVKISLSKDILYLRMETGARLLDAAELKHILEQVSTATDEIYPQIKEFLPHGK